MVGEGIRLRGRGVGEVKGGGRIALAHNPGGLHGEEKKSLSARQKINC